MSQNPAHSLIVTDQQLLVALAEQVFDLVWRFDFTAPGFALIDTGPAIDSPTLRFGWWFSSSN